MRDSTINGIRCVVAGMREEKRASASMGVPVPNAVSEAYLLGICKAAEAAGIDPGLLVRGMMADAAVEKRAAPTPAGGRNILKLLGKLGLWGTAAYGGYSGGRDVYKAMFSDSPDTPIPGAQPASEQNGGQSIIDTIARYASTGYDKVKNFATENPRTAAGIAIGVPLLTYLAYKALSSKDDDRRSYYGY